MDMQPNILPTATPVIQTSPSKSKHSGLSILFMILLTGVLIILSEKILFDVNKAFNPSDRTSCRTSYSQNCDYVAIKDKYEANRLLIHALVTLPILLGAVLVYLLYERKTMSGGHVASWAYFASAFWLCIRLLGEMMYFLIRKYESLGIYIVLAVFATILTWLVVVLQRRHAARLNHPALPQ
jgi:hypothetical protein